MCPVHPAATAHRTRRRTPHETPFAAARTAAPNRPEHDHQDRRTT
ncbi:hypothetical protein AB0O01_22615 [Streptomyces sp. NPDC093252]